MMFRGCMCMSNHYTVHFKYVQCIACQLYLDIKLFKNCNATGREAVEVGNLIHCSGKVTLAYDGMTRDLRDTGHTNRRREM
jgi:hypothetical protein